MGTTQTFVSSSRVIMAKICDRRGQTLDEDPLPLMSPKELLKVPALIERVNIWCQGDMTIFIFTSQNFKLRYYCLYFEVHQQQCQCTILDIIFGLHKQMLDCPCIFRIYGGNSFVT